MPSNSVLSCMTAYLSRVCSFLSSQGVFGLVGIAWFWFSILIKCSVFVREDKVKEMCLSWGTDGSGGPVFTAWSQNGCSEESPFLPFFIPQYI